MTINLQPTIENNRVKLQPLNEGDFEELFSVASNPKIWEQHPNKDRYKREVFQTYFEGAMQSKGAFKIIEKSSNKIAGCSRFYEYNEEESSIKIGYTFYGTEYWGTGINHAVKALMLDYIFGFVSNVYFEIGAGNIRSQIAITRLGAKKIGEKEIAYFGEPEKLNFIYSIDKSEWIKISSTQRTQ